MASTWLPVFEAQRPSTPGAVAHMSLHLNLQCQRTHRQNLADDHGTPILLPGDLVSDYVGDRCGRELSRPLPAGERAYMEGVLTRQMDFAFFLQLLPNRPVLRGFFEALARDVFGGLARFPQRIARIGPDSGIVSKTLSARALRVRSNEHRLPFSYR